MTRTRILTLARMLIAGAWAQSYARLGLTVAAIAMGIALGVSVHTINYSAAAELSLAVRSVAGEADISVHAGRSDFSEELYAQLATRPEIAAASPAIEINAKLPGRPDTLPILGIDPLRASVLQPGLLGDAADRVTDLLQPGSVMLSLPAARKLGLMAGGTLEVQVGLRRHVLRVIAVLPLNESLRQPLALMDIASAQWGFDRLGMLTRVDLRLRPGNNPAAVIARLGELLPPGVQAVEPQMAASQSLALSRAYRVNLNMLALISLLTGTVLVFSTQALSLLRRRTHFALLRALGLTQRQLKAVLLAEAGTLGLLGAVLGVGLGILAAYFALLHTGADLGAGFFQGITARLHIDTLGVSLIAATGFGASMLGGAVPAWDAADAPPGRALRAGDEQHPFARTPRALPGLALLAIGFILLMLPPIDDLPVFGYVAIGCLLVGALLLMPWYARLALHAVPLPRQSSARLALDQLRESTGFAGVSLATMLTSISLAVAMLIMIHSFRHSLDAWLGNVLPADLYVRAGAESSAWLDPATQERIRSAPGVAQAAFSRHKSLQLDPARPLVTLIARDLDPNNLQAVPLIAPQQLPRDGTIPVWISEAMRDLYAAQVGQRIRLPIGKTGVEVTIAGIWRDYIRQGGAVLIGRSDYVQLTADLLVNDAWLWVSAGQQPAQVAQSLRERLDVGPGLEIREPATLRSRSLAIFDQTFAVTYVLQFAALALALFGIGITFSAQALARRAEFGMLHHIGMTRRELGLMLGVEGALLGALGACAGVLVGATLSAVLVHVINRQSFHWSMEMYWPVTSLATLSVVLVACCALTAAISARRALGRDAIRAVREDW